MHCAVRRKIYCTGLTRAAKAEQKSLVPARQAQWTNEGRTPFICTLWFPIHLSFNSQHGPPLSGPSANIKRGLLNFILFQEGGGWGGAGGIGDGNSVCNGIIVDLFLHVPITVISTWFVQIWTPFMWIRVKGVWVRIHQKFWNGNTINNKYGTYAENDFL